MVAICDKFKGATFGLGSKSEAFFSIGGTCGHSAFTPTPERHLVNQGMNSKEVEKSYLKGK